MRRHFYSFHGGGRILGAGLRLIAAAVAAVGLSLAAGCSSSGSNATAFTPPPPPPPPPPLPPPPEDFRTAEFQNQPGLEQINVVPAYEQGALGAAVLVAIIDTGIDVDNIEFEGRIDPRSADLVAPGIVPDDKLRPGGPDLQDVDGHGTAVAGIIAAAKNDLGMHGVAPEAQILMFRGDDESDSLMILGEAIVEGVIRSANAGAGVLNLSLGSDEPEARDDFANILEFTSRNDMVVAVAAGNDGLDDPEASALGAIDPLARGTAIIVGAVDFNNQIASFSNRAGTGAEFFLVAPGLRVPTVPIGRSPGLMRAFSGTSASTPHVAGAAALIRELWPQLSAAEVVDILLTSATDLGAAGTDPIFGRGLLNVGAAIAPLGGTSVSSVSGITSAVSDAGLQLSTPFGDATLSFDDIIVLDGFNRDFRADIGGLVRPAGDRRADPFAYLHPFTSYRSAAQMLGAGALHVRLHSRDLTFSDPAAAARSGRSGLAAQENDLDRDLALSFTQPLAEAARVTVAHGFAPYEIAAMASRRGLGRWLARDAFADAYLPKTGDALTSFIEIGRAGKVRYDLLMAQSFGDETLVIDGRAPFDPNRLPAERVTSLRVGASRDFDRGSLRLEGGLRYERGGVLGARFGSAFAGGVDALTAYHAVSGDWALTRNWRLQGRYAVGYTKSAGGAGTGLYDGLSGLVSTQASVGLSSRNLFAAGDRLSLSATQPLRVERGALKLILPTAFDKRTETLGFTRERVAFHAGSREIDLEARYMTPGPFGAGIEINLLHQLAAGPGGRDATTLLLRSGIAF